MTAQLPDTLAELREMRDRLENDARALAAAMNRSREYEAKKAEVLALCALRMFVHSHPSAPSSEISVGQSRGGDCARGCAARADVG